MQLNSRFWPVLSLVVFTTFIACKKDSQEPQQQNQNPELTTHTDDQARVSNEMDAVSLDLNVALEKTTSFSGRIMGDSLCSATLSYDTLNATKKITITYNGADCWGGNTRTGSVLISMPSGVHWKDVGVFGSNYNGIELYIKFSIGAAGAPVVCLSFHESGHPMRYQFK